MVFGDLHSHSDYSIFDGFAKIEDKISKAIELGYTALGMTEHGTTTGLIPFYKECKKQGIKPVLGYEGYFTMEPEVKGGETFHILLLAKDLIGYRNLMKIATYGTNHFYRKPRIGIEILQLCHEGIICSTACVAGIMVHPEESMISDILQSIFQDDFYYEIQPHDFELQKTYNLDIINKSLQRGIKTIITLDSHYINKEDDKYHKLWIRLSDGSYYYSSNDFYLMTMEEINSKLSYLTSEQIKQFINNTEEVINKCNVEIPFDELHYPVFDISNPMQYIKDKCNIGWNKKGINKLPNRAVYKAQVLHEFEVLTTCQYLNYFCIIDDIMSWCHKQGIATGIGRGSVCGSTVAYLMGITDIDPIKHDLVFERFANPERVTPCDIDEDFASDRRSEVIEYIREKYGDVFQIRTINYVGEKAAIQRAGQSLEMPPSEIDKISKNLNTLESLPLSDLKRLALKFVGHIQNYGVHASAVVVFPEDANRWCAIEKQGDNMVAAQEFHCLEEQGILKLDILGVETISVIDNTLKRIGNGLDLSTIPWNDKKTVDLLLAGKTQGCFQIASQTMTNIIRDIHLKDVYDLIDTVALGRPGPLDCGMVDTFINRRNGETITYLHPKLEPILKSTEGIILYQEQILQIARDLCGYTYGEADVLRRIIGRKETEKMQKAINELIEAGVNNGIPRNIITEISTQIVTFALYGFNKGHSAAYGHTAWRTAYLKANYPAEFMASLFDSVCQDKPKLTTYIMDARSLGLKIIPPSIKSGSMKCIVGGDTVMLGFTCISGVGNSLINNGSEDFKLYIDDNNKLNKKVLSNLIMAGCFTSNRSEDLEYLTWYKDKRKSKGDFICSGITDMCDAEMEFKAIGYSFHNIFESYNIDMANNRTTFAMEIIDVKAHKTKKGKPMAFVKARTPNKVMELVIFNNTFNKLEKGKVYIIRLKDTMIQDFVKALSK